MRQTRTRRMSIARLLLASWGAAAACDGDGTSSTLTVRDSAGIRIVDNHGTAEAEAAWRIPSEPLYRIGWGEGDPLFEDVATGVVLDDRRVAVGDAASQLIHVLSPSGRVRSTFGGEGEGPDEFTRLSAVVPLDGDTLLVQQAFDPRLSIFSPDGRLLGTGRFENLIDGGLYGILGRTRNHDYVLWPTQGFMARAAPSAGWLSFPVLRARPDFARFDTLADAGMMIVRQRGNLNPIRPSGSVAVAGDRIVHGTNDRAEVTWVDASGVVVEIARWDASPPEPTGEHWADYEQRYREQYAGRYEPEELDQRLADQRRDFAGPLPYFDELHGDDAGNVWLGEYDLATPGPRGRRFSIVSAEGRWLGTVTFPRDVRPLDITDDVFLAVEYDDLDVQAVALYQIEKSGG